MLNKDDHTYNDIREKSLLQWLDEMENHEDIAVHCGVRLAKEYLEYLKYEINTLTDRCQVKDEYLAKIRDNIFNRTSVRVYNPKQIAKPRIERILRAAMAAPSACNGQPWEFFVVTDKEKLEQLSTASPYAGPAKNAPMAIVCAYRKDSKVPEYAALDLGAAIENMVLEAKLMGIGSVWLGIAPDEERMSKVEELLEFNSNLRAFAIVPFGYPYETKEVEDRYDEDRVHYIS